MHLTDIHHQYALERQQRLRDEAAAHRLAGSVPARDRAAALLRRTADRIDSAIARGGPRPAAERGC